MDKQRLNEVLVNQSRCNINNVRFLIFKFHVPSVEFLLHGVKRSCLSAELAVTCTTTFK